MRDIMNEIDTTLKNIPVSKEIMKKYFGLLLLMMTIFVLSACSASKGEAAKSIETGIDNINIYGSIVLTIGPESMKELGYENVFIGTVEGEPEETSCENVIEAVKNAGYKKVVLRPLMVVAGDHANNDMAGEDPDSWASIFKNDGYEVEVLLRGLGENEAIRQIYIDHAKEAIDSIAE